MSCCQPLIGGLATAFISMTRSKMIFLSFESSPHHWHVWPPPRYRRDACLIFSRCHSTKMNLLFRPVVVLDLWWACFFEQLLRDHSTNIFFQKLIAHFLQWGLFGALSVQVCERTTSALSVSILIHYNILFRSLLLGFAERSSLSKGSSLWGVYCRIGSNDPIYENGVPRICCWVRKHSGLRWNWSPLVYRTDTHCYWCV